MPHLTELLRIPTSGARAVEPFTLDGSSFLAIPQLSSDAPGTPPGMNGGDSDTDLLLLRRTQDGYVEHQRLPASGGEDAEFFWIGTRAFLAVASIRSGRGPYEYRVDQIIYSWDGERFTPFQIIPAFAAKQWRHFTIGDRHFLALAQGVSLPQHREHNRASMIYAWDGQVFRPFQEIPSRWAYNWHKFAIGDEHFLAHADNVDPSVLYRWDGEKFSPYQTLVETEGRAFATFTVDDEFYLACAVLDADSLVYRWDNGKFVQHQLLEGAGAREFAVIASPLKTYLVRVNFLLGGRENPRTDLDSQLYSWVDGRFVDVERFATLGGTDVAVYPDGERLLVAVSNSLTADIHFSTETCVYEFTD
jgi:hypothetical protein